MTMSPCENLVFILPDEAAARLKELAAQESQTVAAFVAKVVDDWLEKRRREARLGTTKHWKTLSQVKTGTKRG